MSEHTQGVMNCTGPDCPACKMIEKTKEMMQERVQELKGMGFDKAYIDEETGLLYAQCSLCAVAVIQRVPCHETGCPNKGKDFSNE